MSNLLDTVVEQWYKTCGSNQQMSDLYGPLNEMEPNPILLEWATTRDYTAQAPRGKANVTVLVKENSNKMHPKNIFAIRGSADSSSGCLLSPA